MIVWFIGFSFFFVLNSSQENSDKTWIYTVRAGQGDIKLNASNKDLKSCRLIDNNNNSSEYLRNETNSAIRCSFTKDTCYLQLMRVTVEHAGTWTVIPLTNTSQEIKHIFQIFFENQGTIEFGNTRRVMEGYRANVKFREQLDNLIECNVTSPAGDSYIVPSKEAKDKGIELLGKCGISVPANVIFNGKWILRAIFNNFTILKSEVKIVLVGPSDPESKEIHLERGVKGLIQFTLGDGIIACNMIDPRGKFISLPNRDCSYKINRVTKFHEGQWRAIYAYQGSLSPIEMYFTVHTFDKILIKTNLKIDESGEAILTCQDNRYAMRKFCRFIGPNNVEFDVSQGIGDDSYESYWEDSNYKESNCSLVIRKPSSRDYGTWRCEIVIVGEKSEGSIIQLNDPAWTEPRNIPIHTRDVLIKRGDSFQMKCVADAILDYCYFTSPNGTVYAITDNDEAVSESKLLFKGSGHLSLGQCWANVPFAYDNFNGEWKCSMASTNGLELHEKFAVTVVDDYVIAETSKLLVNNTENVRLSGHLLPSIDDREIQFCQWINPSGYQIDNNQRDKRYKTEKNHSHCELMITKLDVQDDIGNWKCIANLIREPKVTSFNINITYNGIAYFNSDMNTQYKYYTIWFYLAISISIISLILSLIVFNKFRNDHQKRLGIAQYLSSIRPKNEKNAFPKYPKDNLETQADIK